ncbi:DNA mismatch repair endonuclease MutL [bacterium]|nr:DNA mismatch repair endonuclease MutL [bacterium]MCI0603631.1 DNA mismatch repair endonuclease MutL [bacterium]
MSRIALLPDEVVNKIAAGEIIERPVSIVKELIENSLDAGATEIRVEIERGGKQLIRVSDDGSGIAADQALLAFERHATSKIQSSEDLHQIATMGFRGEALASIAAVSQVQLKTQREEESAGVSLFLVGGKCQSQQPAALPHGTIFEARNLFFNTPARKKFLKSDGTEASAITHMVQAFAMAHPEISFSLHQDQRETLNCPKTTTLRERIYQILGAEILEQLVELNETLYHFHLTGFVSNTSAMKTNKNYQYFFINRRLVKDKVLSNSIYVAYRVYAETGQYPVALLFLDMPAAMVDVNVHPAKYEVRFLQQSLVQKGIIDSIQKLLNQSRPLPSFQLSPNSYIPKYSAPELNLQSAAPSVNPFLDAPSAASGLSMPAPAPRKMPQPGEYKIIGQYDNTYVVLSDEGGLILVDQHVAHERVLYELLLRKQESREIHRQNLLIPLVLELNPAQMMLMEDYADHFRELGFDIEVFGNGSVMIRQIPDFLVDANYSAAMQRLFNELERLYRDGVLESFAEEMRKSMACQAAVKINMPLTIEKMEWLIAELLKTNTPQVCPHGRPIILRISHYEIEKNFRRI